MHLYFIIVKYLLKYLFITLIFYYLTTIFTKNLNFKARPYMYKSKCPVIGSQGSIKK